jgi:hypothetical protein
LAFPIQDLRRGAPIRYHRTNARLSVFGYFDVPGTHLGRYSAYWVKVCPNRLTLFSLSFEWRLIAANSSVGVASDPFFNRLGVLPLTAVTH